MFYFYVLESSKNKLYFGSTNDMRKRLTEHNSGKSYYTKGDKWTLIYYEAYRSEKDARIRESRIKHHGQAKAQLKQRIATSRLPKVSAGQAGA